MIEIFFIYAFIGGVWAYWLNYYCSNNLEYPYNIPMSEWELVVHVTFWPLTFSSFLFELIYDMYKQFKNK